MTYHDFNFLISLKVISLDYHTFPPNIYHVHQYKRIRNLIFSNTEHTFPNGHRHRIGLILYIVSSKSIGAEISQTDFISKIVYKLTKILKTSNDRLEIIPQLSQENLITVF